MRHVRALSGAGSLFIAMAFASSCSSSSDASSPTYASIDTSELDNALKGSPSAAVKAVNAALQAQLTLQELETIELQWHPDPLSPENGDLLTSAAFMKALRVTAETLDKIGYHAPSTPDAAFVAPASLRPMLATKARMTCTGEMVCTDLMNGVQTVSFNVASRFAKDGKRSCYDYDVQDCLPAILVICDGAIYNRGPGTYVGAFGELDKCVSTECKVGSGGTGTGTGTGTGGGNCISTVCNDPSTSACPSGRADLGCYCYPMPPSAPSASSGATLQSKCAPTGSNVSGGPYCCAKVDPAANSGASCICAYVMGSDCSVLATALNGTQVPSCPAN